MSRAMKKAEDERELQKSKQREIERLQDEIAQLADLKEKFQNKLQKYSKFNKYLEQVCFKSSLIFFFQAISPC